MSPTNAERARERDRPLATCAIVCAVVVALSFALGAASARGDVRVRAIKAIYDGDTYSNVGDPMPSLAAARKLRETPRAPIYDPEHVESSFLYPPVAALFYAPLAGLSLERARRAIIVASHVEWIAIGFVLLALLRGGRGERRLRFAEVVATAIVMCAFYPLVRALEINQAGLAVTLLIGLAWLALSAEMHVASGLLLAIAIAFKPHLVLALPLLVFHARRAVLAALAACAALFALSIAYAGWQNHVTYATRLLPSLARGYVAYQNQSFNGLFNRLFVDQADLTAFVAAPPRAMVRALTLSTSVLAWGLCMVQAWRLRGEAVAAHFMLGLGWLAATLASPLAWEHSWAPSLFVFAAAYRMYVEDDGDGDVARAPQEPQPAWWPPVTLLAPLGVAFVLMASWFDVRAIAGTLPRLFASYVLYGGILLAVVYAALLRALAARRSP